MLIPIWFILWGLLWAVYFMLDGFDLGAGMLLPVIARNDREKAMIYRAIGPFWDGNEVWLVADGGVTFAAFPAAYAALFTALYAPLMVVLFALILRATAIEFREQLENMFWQRFWDSCFALVSFVAAFFFGLIFANLFRGIPLDGAGMFQGSFGSLFNLYGLTGGVLFVALFLLHGALWLGIKSTGVLLDRATRLSRLLWVVTLILSILFLALTAVATKLFANYFDKPLLLIIPLAAAAGLVMMPRLLKGNRRWGAWFTSCLVIAGIALFGVMGMYPHLIPSSLDPAFGVTVHAAASSPSTLKIMLGVVLIFVPLAIIYQGWVYRFFKEAIYKDELIQGEPY